MSSEDPHPARHDDVRLTRRERRAFARLEVDFSTGSPTASPGSVRRADHRSDPVVLLAVGLAVLLLGAVMTSVVVVMVGVAVSVSALLRAGLPPGRGRGLPATSG